MLSIIVLSVLCGEMVPLSDKVFGSTRVAEFTISFQAKKPTVTGRLLFPPESTEPVPELKHGLTKNSPCQRLVKGKQLKLLAFFDANGRQLVGVEQSIGHGTDLDPAYPALVEAVLEAKGWSDERMRAVGADQLWQPQKRALASSKNAYLQRLAVSFLAKHGAAEVVDAAWGASGSEERKYNESRATVQRDSLCPVF